MSSKVVRDDALNMDIHPDLAKLRQEYERITSDFEHGHLQEDDARSAIGSLIVFDDTGAAWGIDLYGRFVRQASPGSEAVPASPHSYGIKVEDLGASRTVIDGQEWVVPVTVAQDGETGMRSIQPHRKTLSERLKSIPVGERTRHLVTSNRSTLIVVGVLFLIFFSVKLAGDNGAPTGETQIISSSIATTTITQEQLNSILQALKDPGSVQSVTVETVSAEMATEVSTKLEALALTGTLTATEQGLVVVAADGSVLAQFQWSLLLDNGVWRIERLSAMFPN